MSLYAKYVPAQLGGGGGGGIKGDLTESGSANLTVTGGTGAVNGTGTVLTLTGSTMLETVSSVLTITGGTNAVLGTGVTIQVKQATTSQAGYLSSADWNTFNGKQAAGNYITALTGDVTATGPGSVAATIAANAVTNAKAAQMATLTIKGNNTGGTANALDLTVAQVQTMLGTSGTNTGDVTIGTFGSSPTANGASLSGQVLTLQPANGSNPGSLTAVAQSIGGDKTFNGNVLVAGVISSTAATNSTGISLKPTTVATSNTTHQASQILTIRAAIWNGTSSVDKGINITNVGISGTNSAYQLDFGSSDVANILDIRGDTGNISMSGNLTVTGGLVGVTTNSSAGAGIIGQYISSVIGSGSGVSLTTGTGANVTSISLTAGDWDVSGIVSYTGTAVTTVTTSGISTTSATTSNIGDAAVQSPTGPNAAADSSFSIPGYRLSLSGTTTVFLVAKASFSGSTLNAYGRISARRVR